MKQTVDPQTQREIARRRTFAIISHPDAGKTTLTEKLLLYGGAIQLAGAVSAKQKQRATASDWMELEKKRGISVSSTVLQFDYDTYRVNLLDTPGHNDFSEDTYRVLTAVDAAVMVIDGAKGLESQTFKLFEVCRRRKIPLFTFINKVDRPIREPLELLDELESALGLEPYAMNWPLGSGSEFKGVYDRRSRQAHLFERTPGGTYRAPVTVHGVQDLALAASVSPEAFQRFVEETDVLEGAGHAFDPGSVLEGKQTPVFFGSATNTFGVELLLKGFLEFSAPPAPRKSLRGVIQPEDPRFSGFIFKIQANMDPRHRDCLAFMRICSGVFRRDMLVHHSGSKEEVKLTYSHKLFGRERETLDDGYPGDIVGLVGHSEFRIGDTLTEDPQIEYREIPRFPPESFAVLHNVNTAKFKSFRKGLQQLLDEGILQTFTLDRSGSQTLVLGAVGPLQFDVVRFRLESEYGAESTLEPLPWKIIRWIGSGSVDEDGLPSGTRRGKDADGNPVLMFVDEWTVRYFAERHPTLELLTQSPTANPVPTQRDGNTD